MNIKNQYLIIGFLDENGEVYREQKISPDEFEIEHIDSEERQMGGEVCYQLSYEGDGFSIERQIYEYPSGIYNNHSGWAVTGEIEIISDNLPYQDLFS